MYTHVKYDGPNSYQSTDMASINFFADKQTDGRTNGEVKNYMS